MNDDKIDSSKLQLTVVFTASGWEPGTRNGKPCVIRLWSGPPADKTNAAACVWEKTKCWPFRSCGWLVWSPFADEDADKGFARSEGEAKAAADVALRAFIADAERGQ